MKTDPLVYRPGLGVMHESEMERATGSFRMENGVMGPSPELPFWLMQAECAYFESLDCEPEDVDSDRVRDEVLTAAVRIDEFTYDSFAVLRGGR